MYLFRQWNRWSCWISSQNFSFLRNNFNKTNPIVKRVSQTLQLPSCIVFLVTRHERRHELASVILKALEVLQTFRFASEYFPDVSFVSDVRIYCYCNVIVVIISLKKMIDFYLPLESFLRVCFTNENLAV